ncbi:MAG: SSI family serine proteinase inhibitor [Jiangellaceae bacterium]
MKRRLLVPFVLTALLAVAGCGAGDDETIATPEPSPAGTSASPSSPAESSRATPTPTPTPSKPPGEPPTEPRTDHPTAPGSEPPAGEPAEGPPDTTLTITVNTGTAEGSVEWTLRCGPPGGTHPDPGAACASLAEADPGVFDPVPPDQACTQIYGGPETATVTGELRGERLMAEFARNNGCEINRWDALADVFQFGESR